MIFIKVFVLITLAILTTANKDQGKIDLNQRQSPENTDFQSLASPQLLYDSIWERHLERHSSTVFDSGKILRHLSNFKDFPKEPNPIENHFKISKSHDLESANSYRETKNNSEKDRHKSINPQKVYCHHIMKSELNTQDNIIDSVQHNCDPLPSATPPYTLTVSSLSSLPYVQKENRFGRLISSTPAGINCRRIMNSELNERGEIVDSVTEVCDPPTTTTTTTKKPRLTTTAKTTTTTPKPLVKVCRPVMNSYLSEEGEIIDSVTMVCKMETVV